MNLNLGKLSLALLVLVFVSCSKDDNSNGDIGGSQSEFGELGNELNWEVGQFGVLDAEMKVIELKDGVSTFECSGSTSNSAYIDILNMMPSKGFPGTISVNGNTVEATINAKFTDQGAQIIFNDGTRMTVVDYDSKVGDKYSATVDGEKYELEVIEKSTEDDYFWIGGLLLKVTTVRAKNPSPGVKYIDAYFNHKFALVGSRITFEDGSVKYAGVDGF